RPLWTRGYSRKNGRGPWGRERGAHAARSLPHGKCSWPKLPELAKIAGRLDVFSLQRGDFAMAQKTTCPISRQQFRDGAEPLKVTVNAIPCVAEVKEFATGSLGWYLNGKTTVQVGGKTVSVQIGLNLTSVGSKDLPKDNVEAAQEP